MQPQEFYKLLDGWRWRQDCLEDTMAYFTACLMNTQLTKAHQVKPYDLIKPLRADKVKQKMREDKKHLEQVVKERKEALGHDDTC